jgi:hypothetical protein
LELNLDNHCVNALVLNIFFEVSIKKS